MQIHLIHINTIFEYFHSSVILDNVNVLYLKNGNVHRPLLKNNNVTMFFLKKSFLVNEGEYEWL